MDNPECGALDEKNALGGTWMKKRYRYEEDDNLAFSPPDESSFLTLRFGKLQNKPLESMYDRINKEMGLSIENGNDTLTSENLSTTKKEPVELLFGSKGINLDKLKLQQPHAAEHIFIATASPSNSPKLIRHPNFVPIIERTEEKELDSDSTSTFVCPKPDGEEFKQAPLSGNTPEKPEDSLVARQDIDTLVRKARGGRPTRKISMNLAETFDHTLLDSVRELKLDVKPTEPPSLPADLPSLPADSVTAALPSFHTAHTAFDSAPPILSSRRTDRLRKTSAPPSLNPMLPETQKAHNFFFTGSLFSAVAPLSSPSSQVVSPSTSHLDLSTTVPSHDFMDASKTSSLQSPPIKELDSIKEGSSLMKATSQMEEGMREAASLEPKPRMARRRPRASALREMNFMAPQSS